MTALGVENEFGVSVAGVPGDQVDPVALSAAVVTAGTSLATRWDYEHESPLRDARGGHLPREAAIPELLTDETRYANRLLPNGGRFYVDHAHPEYSGPEVASARDVVAWDAAGDRIVRAAAQRASEHLGLPIRIHKNNTDGKGASYGCHENHLVPRSVDFDAVVGQFTGHLVSRVVFSGAGRVGLGRHGEVAGFQLTQRADFFERRVGLETTTRRPLVNTRDEPHADPRRWRRLHVITGDALVAPVARWVSIGSSALVLQAIAEGRCQAPELPDPVAAFTRFSRDLGLGEAVALQRHYLAAAATVLDEAWLPDASEVHAEWARLLDDAERDPLSLADRVDWAAKLKLLTGMAQRRGWDWASPELRAMDLQWADLDPTRGLAQRLLAAGALRPVASEPEIARAVESPPRDTRAWLRATLMARHPEAVDHATWDQVSLTRSHGTIEAVRLPEPLADTAADWEQALGGCRSVDEVLDVVARRVG